MEKPDFAAMTLDQQVTAYNELSETKRKSRFSTKEIGLRSLESAWKAKHGEAPKGKKAPKKAASKEPRVTKRMKMSIKVLTKDNPRRPDTEGFRYYETLKKSKTVEDYLKAYQGEKAVRDARLWLYYNIRDKHVALVA